MNDSKSAYIKKEDLIKLIGKKRLSDHIKKNVSVDHLIEHYIESMNINQMKILIKSLE